MKILFYSPSRITQNAKNLIIYMLDTHRFRYSGIFAIYSFSIMLQEDQLGCKDDAFLVYGNSEVMRTMLRLLSTVLD